ncbi:hypothetical protein ABT095_06030 [Kitasatospora sp. NPDC002227]|uniref:hypothetical protein n=1 Tax=Kitasatospora sp. NPDC002227 TaxID=3154773 RepID=UPI0033277C96
MTTLDRTARDDSPRDDSLREPGPAAPRGLDAEAATTANLRSGLAARLRVAYERGTDIAALALACHQSPAEVRELLRTTGVVLSAEEQAPVAPTPSEQLRRVRRPTPSRRLSRLHPKSDAPVVPPPAEAPPAPAAAATSAPLGILIGASPSYTEPPGQPESREPRRVPAQVVRVGRGTSLVVLPSWRTAIAVSVPTELLVRETGLRPEQLSGARLTVRMNPEALHDRELDLAEWRPEALGRRAR